MTVWWDGEALFILPTMTKPLIPILHSIQAMAKPRFLIVTYPMQSHINPGIEFSTRLLRAGAAEVTFATSASVLPRMDLAGGVPEGLTLAAYSDGVDDFDRMRKVDVSQYMSGLERSGSQTVVQLIQDASRDGRPFDCLLYTTLVSWAGRVAREHRVPSVPLWIQPATVFLIYYHYFNGYGDAITHAAKDPSGTVDLPGLPRLTTSDLPSFLLPTSTDDYGLPLLREHMQLLAEEAHPQVLVNSFDALEAEAIKAVDGVEVLGVGPLIPLPLFSDNEKETVGSAAAARIDIYQSRRECMEWLNEQRESSVIYVSFGSYSNLPKAQMEEIARALLDSEKPFLWVVRALEGGGEEEEEVISCREEVEKKGKMVAWCSQLEVLSHRAVGCFVTHCGWNSTTESLVLGTPVVAVPLWTDQMTNAKLIEEVWGVGVRARRGEEGAVGREEMRRCLEMAMGGGEKGKELRMNSEKWKELAREGVREGGSSDHNLKTFVGRFRGATDC